MNTAKMYQILTGMESSIKEAGIYSLLEDYGTLVDMVKEELAKEAEKAAGRKASVRNAAKKFLGRADSHKSLQRGLIQEIGGEQYIGYCNGYALAWSPIDFGFGIAEKHETFPWGSIVSGTRDKLDGVIPITKEFKEKLIIFAKTHKKDRTPFIIKSGNYYTAKFNPAFLKMAIDFTGATEIRINTQEDGYKTAIILDGEEDRHALLLPIR